jgi:hypothetical protein
MTVIRRSLLVATAVLGGGLALAQETKDAPAPKHRVLVELFTSQG